MQATGRESGNKWNGDHWTPINSGTASPNANNVRAYTRNYSYDKVGNVQELVHQATSNNFTRVYNYVSGLDHLANISPASGPPTPNASFLYDAVGNLVQTDTQRFYQWDAADQLVYTKVHPSGGPVQMQAAYLYDAGGQRVKRYVRGALGGTFDATVYIDGVYEHRYQDSAHLTTIMVKAGRSQLASLRIGDPLDGSTPPLTYELEDHLGTIVARLDGSGALYDSEEFYPFGEHCLRQFTMKRYGYVGKEYDVETGLLYYGARYYAAWTCRFISVDPLAHDYPYLTPYNYAGNKPIGDLDIDGLQSTGDPPGPTSYQSGDAKLDAAANRILSDNDCHNVGIVTDGNRQTTITVNGDIVAKYHPEAGFVNSNDRPLQMTGSGHLVPTPGSKDGGGPRKVYDPEFGLAGPIGPAKSAGPVVSEASPLPTQDSKIEPEVSPSYNDDRKSGIQTTTENVEKFTGVTEPIIGGTAKKFAKERGVRDRFRRAIHSATKRFESVSSGKVYQWTKKWLPRIGTGLKGFALAITPATVAWELLTDTWDAHTFVNAAVFIGLLFLGGVLGPIGAVAIGVAWIALDMDKRIDAKFGRKANPEMWHPVEQVVNGVAKPFYKL